MAAAGFQPAFFTAEICLAKPGHSEYSATNSLFILLRRQASDHSQVFERCNIASD
jgi:hypothetical protein